MIEDSDLTSEGEYVVKSSTNELITGIEFTAGNDSSFKLGVDSITSIDYESDIEINLAYTITDENSDVAFGSISVTLDGNDIVEAKISDDVILYDSNDTLVDGGAGTDTMVFKDSDDAIDISALAAKTQNIEVIDLSLNGDHSLSNVSLSDVVGLTDVNNELRIIGDSSDSVSLVDTDWDAGVAGMVGSSDEGYTIYTGSDSSSIIKIDDNINLSMV